MTDWESILRADGPAVWRTARRLVGNDADADECFQEAFIGAVEFSRGHPVQNWRALLTKLATARAIDHLRRRIRRGSREEAADWEKVAHAGSLPSEQAEVAELSQLLRNALTEIPPQQAEVFCLACLSGWSHAEIAQHLAISVDSVGVTVHRARQKLRRLLASINEVSG
jgi:RNA polymerase sigma-70 factor (ECF subfamily)